MKWFALLVAVGTISFLSTGCLDIDHTDPEFESGEVAPDNEAAVSMASAGGAPPISAVRWLDYDISSWPETTTLNASVSGGTIRLEFDKAGSWPTSSVRASNGGPLSGVAWVIVNRGGQWYGATWDWLRPGQQAKAIGAVTSRGGHITYEELAGWHPRSGETYGFLVSTPARAGGRGRTIDERSNISMVTWP